MAQSFAKDLNSKVHTDALHSLGNILRFTLVTLALYALMIGVLVIT